MTCTQRQIELDRTVQEAYREVMVQAGQVWPLTPPFVAPGPHRRCRSRDHDQGAAMRTPGAVARRLGTLAHLPGLRGFATSVEAAEQNMEVWKARATKEAKGKDPWEAFASTNADVSAGAASSRCTSAGCLAHGQAVCLAQAMHLKYC